MAIQNPNTPITTDHRQRDGGLRLVESMSVQAIGLVKRVVSADGSSPSVILNDVSLDIPGTGLTAIVGPSGAGKTSLLYVLSGLDRPDSGRVVIGGTDIYALDEERRSRFIRGHTGSSDFGV